MKTKDIANQYGIDKDKFEIYLKKSKHKFVTGFTGININDADVDSVVFDYKKYENQQTEEEDRKARAEQEKLDKIRKAELDKKAALASMLITSGFTFDGYTITKYSGYISGDDAIAVDRGFTIFGGAGNVKDKLMESLVFIRRNALAELKEAAYALGCNAVIGVDYDYITLDPQTSNLAGHTVYQPYVFGVTANGNAVTIEKNE